MSQPGDKIVRIDLDGVSIGPGDVNADHERRVAIADLLEGNSFRPDGEVDGPFALRLAIEDDRLVFDVRLEDDTPVRGFVFALGPLRRIIKDYFLICESYYEAVRDAPLERIEAIDMARRSTRMVGPGWAAAVAYIVVLALAFLNSLIHANDGWPARSMSISTRPDGSSP